MSNTPMRSSRRRGEALDLAFRRAQTAEPITEQLTVLPDAELDAPIDPGIIAQPPAAAIAALQVPGYEIVKEISSGGQGTVFRAVQQSTGRIVALKVLPGGRLAGRRARARFDREAQILARLDHPHIVRIIDRCETADGSLVLAMDYIDGHRLDMAWSGVSHTDRAREVAALFAAVAEGVDEAHRLGIVHRDLKPSNILIDRRGIPRVLDFGLARLNGSSTEVSLTASGQMIGSLPWASPEQVSVSDFDSLGASTDVYSLGVMFYQALTGNPPYLTVGPLREVINAIQACEIRPPHLLREGRDRGCDEALSTIVCKCLAKNPLDRYSTAGSMAEDLRRWLMGARPVAHYAARQKTRRRWALLFSVAVFLAMIVFAVLTLQPLDDAPKPPPPPAPLALPAYVNPLGMSFVQIPEKRFMDGSPVNAPDRQENDAVPGGTRVSAFWMGTHEVTRRQYRLVMGELPEVATGSLDDWAPVDGVSWEDAREFCRRLSGQSDRGYRLPTATEWEAACRDTPAYRAFSGPGVPDAVAWYAGNSGGQIREVGLKTANAYGIFDMHGNVAEWTDSVYWVRHKTYWQAGTREIRGGSFVDPVERCRTVSRDFGDETRRLPGVGFRVVMSPFADGTTQPSTSPATTERAVAKIPDLP